MSKFLLFVCLAFFSVSVYCTQIRLINALYDRSRTIGLAANLEDYANTTVGKGVQGAIDLPTQTVTTAKIPATGYTQLPEYSFVVGTPLRMSAISLDNSAPFPEEAGIDITLQQDQSYSFVYVAATPGGDFSVPFVDFRPAALFAIEEIPPSPIPYGKALVRVVNVAVTTSENATNPMPMVVTINGTGVASQQVTVPFGQASDFIVYDSAAELTLYTTLPVDGGNFDRVWLFSTTIDATVVVYVRGDLSLGDLDNGLPSCHLGTLDTTTAFPPAPPTAPVAPPTTPMASEPSAAPLTETPTAPVASTTPTTSRTPTKRVSSAAQTVAQIAGVVALASMLL